jgi:hypothetical protein
MEGRQKLERDFDCIACAAPFKVMNEIMRTEAPEVALDVSCPLCKANNRIAWPPGMRAVVVAKYPQPRR